MGNYVILSISGPPPVFLSSCSHSRMFELYSAKDVRAEFDTVRLFSHSLKVSTFSAQIGKLDFKRRAYEHDLLHHKYTDQP